MKKSRRVTRSKLALGLVVLLLLSLLFSGALSAFASDSGSTYTFNNYELTGPDGQYDVTRVIVEREPIIVRLYFYGYRDKENVRDEDGNIMKEPSGLYVTRPVETPGYELVCTYDLIKGYNMAWIGVEYAYNVFQDDAGYKPEFFYLPYPPWIVHDSPEGFDRTELGYADITYDNLNLGQPGVYLYEYHLYPPIPSGNGGGYTGGGMQGEDPDPPDSGEE